MRVNFSKYWKGIQIAAAVTVVVLFSGLSVVHSAPSGTIEWWESPCGPRHSPVRHARSAGTQQLKISINQLDQLKSTLIDVYSKKARFDTLKKVKLTRCLNLKKLMVDVNKAKDTSKAKIEFYISLKKVAIFLDKLSQKEVVQNSSTFNSSKRSAYYNKMKTHIKNALCEVSFDLTEEDKLSSVKPVKLGGNVKCLDDKLNLTNAAALDIYFYNTAMRFLRQGKRRLLKNSKRKGNKSKHTDKGKHKKRNRTLTSS